MHALQCIISIGDYPRLRITRGDMSQKSPWPLEIPARPPKQMTAQTNPESSSSSLFSSSSRKEMSKEEEVYVFVCYEIIHLV